MAGRLAQRLELVAHADWRRRPWSRSAPARRPRSRREAITHACQSSPRPSSLTPFAFVFNTRERSARCRRSRAARSRRASRPPARDRNPHSASPPRPGSGGCRRAPRRGRRRGGREARLRRSAAPSQLSRLGGVEGELVDLGLGLVGGPTVGRSIFTLWVITGMVMMNMMRRTSMTSMIGVVLIVLNGCSATVA